ncbi:thrombin inhibitor rhodniin-like [Branchiostoma floridae x Branchiostoma belcheri]
MVILYFLVTFLVAGSQAKSLASRQSPCQSFCPLIYMPVCGSNGQTYSNMCDLNVNACELAVQFSNQADFEPLIYAHGGACARKTEKRQFTDSNCLTFCNLMYAPVCGSNGQTYSNSCFLNSASCMATFNDPDSEPITLVHQGGCNGEGMLFPDIGPVMVS